MTYIEIAKRKNNTEAQAIRIEAYAQLLNQKGGKHNGQSKTRGNQNLRT